VLLKSFLFNKSNLSESSLNYWSRQPLSLITLSRSIPSGARILIHKAQFNVADGRLIVPVKSAMEHGMYRDMPWYDPKATMPKMAGNMISYKIPGTYTVLVDWVNWRKVIADYIRDTKVGRKTLVGYTKEEILRHIVYNNHVKFHCDCPSFYWQGMQYNLTNLNSAIFPVHIRSTYWLPKHKARGARDPLCKHIGAVLGDLSRRASYLKGKINRELKNDVAVANLIQTLVGEDESEYSVS
jgi:hypothetical protein